MLKVGLTGSIGSGKSLVGRIFQGLGVPVFDADTEARKLYGIADVQEQLKKIVGKDILLPSGEVDRKRLASILFSDAEKLQQVNSLIHPLVRNAFAEQSLGCSDRPYIIYEAAILVESGHYQEMDRLIVVHAPEEIRRERVMLRDGATLEQVMSRMRHQLPDAERMKFADFVIHNDGSRMVISQVLEIDKALRA